MVRWKRRGSAAQRCFEVFEQFRFSRVIPRRVHKRGNDWKVGKAVISAFLTFVEDVKTKPIVRPFPTDFFNVAHPDSNSEGGKD